MSLPSDKIEVVKRGVQEVLIEEELKSSFLDYAMSVVVSRAIPDVRDGLKPVHRRVLYTMHQLGFFHNRPYHKSVRVVGDVLAKLHPHGDQAVYQTMVGMVQDFSKRYPLLDGQGNWGSVDGDNAAAMRYTEVRMQKIAGEILADIAKETVQFVPNFDESSLEPVLLPSKLPNLLINGTAGIAVGMATSVPPHNLGEVVDACLAILKNPEMSDDQLFEKIPAPDFPTGGIICGRAGIVRAYKTGRGNLILRGVVTEEEDSKKGTRLVITELPYQVNKAELIIKIADLVRNKAIEGISNIRDESDKKGMRLVIELKRGEIPSVIVNQLYKYTSLQTTVSILTLALLDNKPVIFTLRRLLKEFLAHRRKIIYKRTEFDLKKTRAKEHILSGIIIALENIDEVIAIVRKSDEAQDAIFALNKKFLLSEEQAKAILEMRLQRLTGLEQGKIREEIKELKTLMSTLQLILNDTASLDKEIAKELQEIKDSYADKRRTKIEGAVDVLSDLDLIPEEDVVVTLTKKGYVKRVPLKTYEMQHRAGKGKMGMTSLDDSDDVVQDIFVTSTHSELLFFTNFGRVYCMSVFEIPEGSRTAKGRAIVNLLKMIEGEIVVKLLDASDLTGRYVVMLTKNGIIKRTTGDAFVKIRCTGIRALSLRDEDELVFCTISSGEDSIVIATAKGQGIRFHEKEVRQMGRQASGVRGIKLKENDFVVGMEVAGHDAEILVATSKGYGKRTHIKDFRVAHRGGVGVRTIPTGERNGDVIGIAQVGPESQILMIDEAGKIIRISPQEIRTLGRQAQGVRLIKLDDDHVLSSIASFQELHTAQAVDPNYKAPDKVDASEYKDDEEEIDDIEVEMIEDEAAEEEELDNEAEDEMEDEE